MIIKKAASRIRLLKLLNQDLSQGRVSAVSIKCVVICSKFITFAVTKTTEDEEKQDGE